MKPENAIKKISLREKRIGWKMDNENWSDWQLVFLCSVVNGADNRQEMLAVQPFQFPKSTWLQRRNESRLAEKHEQERRDDET